MHLMNRVRPYAVWLWPALLVVAVWRTITIMWPDEFAFVRDIDHSHFPLWDFYCFYYPQAQHLFEGKPVYGYLYPAFLAVAIHPLTALPVGEAARVWWWLIVAALTALWVGTCWLLRVRPIWWALIGTGMVFSYPVLHVIKWGQPGLFMSALVVWALLARRRGWYAVSGVLIGLATVFKFYPGIFVLVFLLGRRRQWRGAIGAAAGAAVFGALIPALVMGPAQWWSFEQQVRANLAATDWRAQGEGVMKTSQHFPFVLQRMLPELTYDQLYPMSLLFAASLIALAWLLLRHAPQLAWIALLLVVPFVVRTSWSHYFSLLIVAQVALLVHFTRHRPPAGVPGLLAVVATGWSLYASSVHITLWSGPENYQAMGLVFWAQVALVVPLVVVCAYAPPTLDDEPLPTRAPALEPEPEPEPEVRPRRAA